MTNSEQIEAAIAELSRENAEITRAYYTAAHKMSELQKELLVAMAVEHFATGTAPKKVTVRKILGKIDGRISTAELATKFKAAKQVEDQITQIIVDPNSLSVYFIGP